MLLAGSVGVITAIMRRGKQSVFTFKKQVVEPKQF
jgi:hypothetical protein